MHGFVVIDIVLYDRIDGREIGFLEQKLKWIHAVLHSQTAFFSFCDCMCVVCVWWGGDKGSGVALQLFCSQQVLHIYYALLII